MWWVIVAAVAGPLQDETVDAPGDDVRPIVGGAPAAAGDWPDAAALFSSDVFTCSGVLIADDLVLTAGHCNWNLGTVQLDTVDYDLAPGPQHAVETVWVHDDFFQTFDISLIRLAEPADVAPAALAVSCMADVLVQDGATATIVGFGATDLAGNDRGSALHAAQVVVEDADCDDPQRGCNQAVMPGGELRAGGGGVDSCSGDSGGPIYVADADGLPWLVGITSRSAVPAETTCGDGGIYVRLDAVRDWIEAQTGEPLPEPDCDGVNQAPTPAPLALEVELGERLTVVIDPADPDTGDQHTFAIEEAPTYGDASIGAGGLLVYAAPDDVVGPDRLTVSVTDDGTPPIAATAIIDIEIVQTDEAAPTGCGCASIRAPATSALAGLLLRRRPCAR